MKDDLEEFISNNRGEFDTYEPPGKLWKAIDKKMHKGTHRKHVQNLAIAASIATIISFAAWVMFSPASKKVSFTNIADTTKPSIQDAEFYYASLVKTQQAQLQRYCNDYPNVCKDFKNEIDTLHILYGQLKTTYDQSYNNEAVLQAMIDNLQAQVKLLSLQLQIIQNLKQKENSDNRNLKTT